MEKSAKGEKIDVKKRGKKHRLIKTRGKINKVKSNIFIRQIDQKYKSM